MAEKTQRNQRQVEDVSSGGSLSEKLSIGDGLDASNQPRYSDKEAKKILRKVDYRLVPILTFIYLLAFLDRGNIGNAKVAGMNRELGLSGTQYNLALTVFFFPYAIFEVPSNIVLKLMSPSTWIAIMMLAWGTVMTLQGIVQNYHGLLITRIFLGLAEAGLFPAATYLLTTWYCRFEVQTRLSIFFSAASLAGAFSGLLAFAIGNMNGVGGLSGWRWIFIIEGLVTVVTGVMIKVILPDSPAQCSFLTPDEKRFIEQRLSEDSGSATGKVSNNDGFDWKPLVSALTEWKIYLAVLVYLANSVPLYGLSYSAPTIILQLGYSAANAQLLTIPIYVLGVISTISFSVLADRQQKRWPYIVIPYSIALCGFIGLIASPKDRLPGLTYAFLFAIPAGVYPPLICILTWVGNNLAPSWKRAVGMALLISIGNLGGAIGSNIFLESQAPEYHLGYGFSIAIITVGICCAFILRWAYQKENKKRDAISDAEISAKYTEQQLLEMGDKNPRYRYVV